MNLTNFYTFLIDNYGNWLEMDITSLKMKMLFIASKQKMKEIMRFGASLLTPSLISTSVTFKGVIPYMPQ